MPIWLNACLVSCSSGQLKLVFQLHIYLSFSEQLICSESKEPEGDWESDILDQINKLEQY